MQINDNRKNNKLTEILGSLDFIDFSSKEALDLTLKSNKVIVEILMEDEYKESD